MGLGGIIGTVAGAGDASTNPFAPALAGGPSAVGDVAVDTRFAPVNVGGLFGSPATGGGANFIVPIALLAVTAIVAAFIFRR